MSPSFWELLQGALCTESHDSDRCAPTRRVWALARPPRDTRCDNNPTACALRPARRPTTAQTVCDKPCSTRQTRSARPGAGELWWLSPNSRRLQPARLLAPATRPHHKPGNRDTETSTARLGHGWALVPVRGASAHGRPRAHLLSSVGLSALRQSRGCVRVDARYSAAAQHTGSGEKSQLPRTLDGIGAACPVWHSGQYSLPAEMHRRWATWDAGSAGQVLQRGGLRQRQNWRRRKEGEKEMEGKSMDRNAGAELGYRLLGLQLWVVSCEL